jgi:hypothetical protein
MTALALALLLQQDPLLEKLKAGEAPEELLAAKDPKLADEVAKAVREKRAWKTDGDRERAIGFFAKAARREHVEELFLVLERESPRLALAVIPTLAGFVGEEHLPRLDGYLAGQDETLAGRALFLIGESRFGAALLEKHAEKWLATKLARVTLHALGACRVKSATEMVRRHYEEKVDDAALRCLGRIWEQKLDAKPLAREEERERLKTFLVLHRLTMISAPTAESAEAMLRVMTGAELDEFLRKQAPEKFASREFVAKAAAARGFEKAKGARIHAALLASPDPNLAAWILWTTPFTLDKAAVAALLEKDAPVGHPDLPKEAKLCDYAAVRLTVLSGQEAKMPETAEKRAAMVAGWREAVKRREY